MVICDEKLCSGCSECAFICPKNAVTMIADGEGFLRPFVDSDKCVECMLCRKKCPVNNRENNSPVQTFAAYSKNNEVRKKSSSGGMFYHLSTEVIAEGGVVIGAGFGEGLKVIHKSCSTEDALYELMGSKYVQSDMGEAYEIIRKCLDEGKKVLFSGAPCLASGVRNAFGNNENLILVDFVCHGVPTPMLWNKYIKEEFPGAENASFRDKKRGWEEFSMKIDTKGKSYVCSQYRDPYLRLFLQNICLRPSCYECTWKGDNYASDITLADFWGISKVFPHMNDDKGTSVLIVRSEKGSSLFEKVRKNMVLEKSETSVVARINTAYNKSAAIPAKRTDFFEDLKNAETFAWLSHKYMKPIPTGEIIKIRAKRTAKKLIGKVSRLKKK